MRLSKIRLNGFKSFVDSTPVPFPGGITAIVGPNGCGKSNIIDAVRWVMGESSAKHLRGGSMADVIFSGSSRRKPVGQASIELVFDNSDGSLGGQYAAFAEIAVRRQVNRDGQSAYYLNATRCRRRDITDVFLGTGLGPRSYSIIEQGTISRLIEAKPEELRGYLEEAAGISLYKERRRETERRMRDTRENLERLVDVRDEVGRQLDKLARQAETAERYRRLKADERQTRAELLLLRMRHLDAEKATLANELAERNNALEARLSEQRSVERDMEALRAQHAEQSDQLNQIQGRYYQLGSDIARIEQRITHRRELRESSARELERNQTALQETETALSADQDKKNLLSERVASLTPELAQADAQLAASQAAVQQAENAGQQVREQRDALASARADAERAAQVERTRIEQIEDRQIEQQHRQQRLADELASLTEANHDQGDDQRAAGQTLEQQRTAIQTRLQALQDALREQRERRDQAQHALEAVRSALADDQARATSLKTLQEAALGSDSQVASWLGELDLAQAPRLGEQLEVNAGWERAVESVLGTALQAIRADQVDKAAARADGLTQGQVMLYDATRAAPASLPTPSQGGARLIDQVQGPAPVADLLTGIYTAEDDVSARALLDQLSAQESVVTRAGHWWRHRWLHLHGAEDGREAGVLERGRELEALTARIAEHHDRLEQAQQTLADAEQSLEDTTAQREQCLAERSDIEGQWAAWQARQQAEQDQQQARQARQTALIEERDDLAEAMEQGMRRLREARTQLEEALEQVSANDQAQAPLQADYAQAEQTLQAARADAEHWREQRQDIALRLESAQTAERSLQEAIARLQHQQSQLHQRNDELHGALADVADSDDDLEADRQTQLAARQSVDNELSEARRNLDACDAQLRELDQRRVQAETAVTELRESAESSRYRDYEIEARLQTQREQLEGLEVDALALAAGLDENATEADWEKALERIDQRIQRLGPINLAAIDEHQSLAERKGYLDEQHADLNEALETLQNAIQRIDRETRTRFRATFDKVNAGLQRLFPRLFGGGQAYLEMTDDDLLETGVTIMARPPGKRISNIHLLSGGEKALAAVSLVFAIFELNPAPFCMLDEVDAPLDEANVGRFCDLLGEMSERVQFIVITHNKTTMEAASHLAGVTMAEPGVSRLVAVDVAAAVELAGADA